MQTEETTTTTELPKTGDRFGRLTVIGPVTGGWHVACTCGHEYIAEQLVTGDDTGDWQRCRKCNLKARQMKKFFTPERLRWVANWKTRLREGKTAAAGEKELKRLEKVLRKINIKMSEWNEGTLNDQLRWLEGAAI
jgi:hypothetical protein